MRPLIIALGRSDNHAILASHALALGVDYRGLESLEASDYLSEPDALASWLNSLETERPVFLAAIDATVSAATYRSFASALESIGISQLALRSDPRSLEVGAKEIEESSDQLYLISIARSPHNQIAIWPVTSLSHEGEVTALIDRYVDPALDSLLESAIEEARESSLVGVMNHVIDPRGIKVIKREFGAAKYTFWSESASYTSVSEEIVRAILDLPLGDTRMIDFEEYFVEEVIDLDSALLKDPIRPFLHLFARNPRLKVRYLDTDDGSMRARISLHASSEDEAMEELAHAREFMLGR